MHPVIAAWLHYVAVILMSGAIVAELYVLKLKPGSETVPLLARIDRLYGIAALAVLLTGFARIPLAHGGKGLDYYLQSGAFHGAMGLFLLAAAISIPPTIRFLKWKKAADTGQLPDATAWAANRKFAHIGLTAIALIALAMAAMARGAG